MSGKDTLRRSDFARMVTDAEAGAFDVLLVYDTSRFARNIEDAYTYRRRLSGRLLRIFRICAVAALHAECVSSVQAPEQAELRETTDSRS